MDYTIYIILGALAVVYFLTKGMNRRSSKNRKSRKFMAGYKKDRHHRTKNDGEPGK
ncbi:MAG TPA: hypothetical protein VLZ54_07425 [Arenibacter sp.]|nr:hypothetical protein [Arenibacter sp.]